MKAKYLGAKKAQRVKKLAKRLKKAGLTLNELAPKEKFTVWQKIKNHLKGLFTKVEKFNNTQ